jgi:DNA-binding NtrC family response regulator
VFLTRTAASMGQPQLRLTTEALAALERHSWPGNVRELRNVIERAAALCAGTGEPITVAHLPASVREGGRGGAAAGTATRTSPLSAPMTLPPGALTSPAASSPEDVRDSLRDFERARIVDALQRCNGNQTQAAELLGLPRRTLAYKMSRLGIAAK